MTPDEFAFWQDQAALLDPLAYEWVLGATQSRTVPGDEHWYMVNGWNVASSGGGTTMFHRAADVDDAMLLPAGTTIATNGTSAAYMYLCKPSLVIGSDGRYATNPKALYFERIARLGALTRYVIGAADTGSGGAQATFPADFTYGFGLHTSVFDMAWLTLLNAAGTAGMNTQNEISDTTSMRFTGRTFFPFARATFPKIAVLGTGSGSAASEFAYVKLPGDW